MTMDTPHRQMKKAIVCLGATVVMLGIALVIGLCQTRNPDYVATIKDTTVTSVVLTMTHGTNHTFYYRGRLLWGWDELLKRVGFGAHRRVQLKIMSGRSQRLR